MVWNEVEDHPQTSSMRRRNKIAQISLTAEIWSNLKVIGDGVPEILGRSSGDRREPERRNAQCAKLIQPGDDIDQTAWPEPKRIDAIDDRCIDPGRVLPFEINCFRPSIPHPERRRAFVDPAYRIDHTYRGVIFPVDRWSSELNAFSLCGETDERTGTTLAGSPLVSNDRRSAGRGNFAHARVQHSTAGCHGGICPRFRRVLDPNSPL